MFFFFNDTATTEIYTLSLHDALPIWVTLAQASCPLWVGERADLMNRGSQTAMQTSHSGEEVRCLQRASMARSEEHTSELQSRQYLVCRLLLEKKKTASRIPPVQYDFI